MFNLNYILIGAILLLAAHTYFNSDNYYGGKIIEGYLKPKDPSMNAFFILCLLGLLIYKFATEDSILTGRKFTIF